MRRWGGRLGCRGFFCGGLVRQEVPYSVEPLKRSENDGRKPDNDFDGMRAESLRQKVQQVSQRIIRLPHDSISGQNNTAAVADEVGWMGIK